LDKYDEDGNDLKTKAYFKVITDKKGNVYGLHYAGPNAGEVMQGYAVAMRMGLTYQMLTRTVGIHPTLAEEFTNIRFKKSAGENPDKEGC
jgi:pyruvate/2-oxoglutarate dehydrogenase complex dihydrolipoamide dehydrogenase (E3) component